MLGRSVVAVERQPPPGGTGLLVEEARAAAHAAGYQSLAVRSRIAQLDGVWRDTVLLERRRAED